MTMIMIHGLLELIEVDYGTLARECSYYFTLWRKKLDITILYTYLKTDHKKAIILNALLDNDDLKHQWAQITTGEDENVTSDLLKQIIQLYLTIRGFAFARSCLELYKRHHSKRLQKSKSLRREITTD